VVPVKDPDGDPVVSYDLEGAPEGMTIEAIDDTTGQITWKELEDEDVGVYEITVIACDSRDKCGSASYTLTVENIPEAPVVTFVYPLWANLKLGGTTLIMRAVCEGESWNHSFMAEAMDPDPGDELTYEWMINDQVQEDVVGPSLSYISQGVEETVVTITTISVKVTDTTGRSAEDRRTIVIGCGPAFQASVPIELSGFVAEPSAEGIVLTWVTSSETNNLGWNVYRSLTEDGPYVKVNERLIPGAGTSSEMKVYEYLDRTVAGSTCWYYLEQIDLNGTRTESARISTATTDAAEETRMELPRTFALKNFPNPFNPATGIEYALPDEHHVRLTIYNTIGQQVAVLVDAVQPAGVYKVTWRPERLQSGVYVYRLEAGSFVQSRKMTYLRKAIGSA
jgi:hypothetical protein